MRFKIDENLPTEVAHYPPNTHSGIILLRLRSQSKYKILQKIRQVIPIIGIKFLEGCIWIIDEQKIRIRGGPGWDVRYKN